MNLIDSVNNTRIEFMIFKSKILTIKNVFIAFIFLKLVEIVNGSLIIGYNIDEPYHLIDGQNWLSKFSYVTEYPTSYVYGPLMGGLSNLLNTLVGNGSIGSYVHNALTFQLTHLVTAFVGVIGTLSFLLLGKKIIPITYLGLLSSTFLLTIPLWTGSLFHNIKDVPLATGYTLISIGLIYFVNFFEDKKKRLISQLIIALGFILVMGTRPAIIFPVLISILFAIFTLWYYIGIKPLRIFKSFILSFSILLVSTPLLLPQFLSEPKLSLLRLIGGSSEFPWTGTTFTAGKLYEANFTLKYYFLWLFAQTPLLILLFFVAGLFFFLKKLNFRKFDKNQFLLTMFFIQFITVPTYALLVQSAIYNGLRHILFIYPAIAIFAAFGLISIFNLAKTEFKKRLVTLLLVLSILIPNIEGLILRPFQQLYFNPVISLFYSISTSWETEFLGTSFREAIQKIPSNGVVASTHEWTFEKNAYAPERGQLANEVNDLSQGDFWQVTSVASYIGGFSRERMIGTKSPLESVRNRCSVENVVSRNLRFEKIPLAIVMRCQNSGKVIPGVAALSWKSNTEVDKDNKIFVWVTSEGEDIRISNLQSTPLKGTFKINLFNDPCNSNKSITVKTKVGKFEETVPTINDFYPLSIPLDIGVFGTEIVSISSNLNNVCKVGLNDPRNFLVGVNKFDIKVK
jgi:hypothetical protein